MADPPTAEPLTLFRAQGHLTGGPLAGRVASAVSYWSTGAEPGVHRGMPSPWLTFIVSFDEPVRMLSDDLATTTGYDVILAGLHPRATLIDSPAAEAGIQLAIEPTACRALFGVPAGEIANSTHEADSVLDAGLGQLREQMHESSDSGGELLRQWLAARSLDGDTAGRPDVVQAWRLITGSAGRLRIDDVARRVALSPRQLRSLFTAEYGLAPKAAARIARLNNATSRLARGIQQEQRIDLATLAHTTGYADQAHLAREFREAIGLSATEWLAQERRNLQAGGHTHDGG